MSSRSRKPQRDAETDPATRVWIAREPLYPPLEGGPATLPVPAYQPGGRVPWPDVERNGWQQQVAAEGEELEDPHGSARAASSVHPVVAAQQEAAAAVAQPAASTEPPESSPAEGGPPADAEAQQTDTSAAEAAGTEE